MNENIELYMWFGVYESPEDFGIELAKYTFSKNYSNDTTDVIIETLAKVYEAQVFIHVDKIQQHPENNVGVDFPNIIHLIKTGQHYLLKQAIDDFPCNVNIRMHRKTKLPQDEKKIENSVR